MSLPLHSFTCQVLHRIEGNGYVDVLVKGFPADSDLADLAMGRTRQVYKSLWPTRWVVRVLTNASEVTS